MKFWHTLQQIKNSTDSSWLAINVLVAIVISLSLGQLGRLYIGNVVVYPHDALISVWLLIESRTVASIIASLQSTNYKKHLSEYLLLAWVLIGMLVSYVITRDPLPWLYAVRLTIYLLFLVTVFKKFKNYSLLLRTAIIVIGSIMVMAGFIQYFYIPDTRFLFTQGWDEHYYRLIGTLLDPNYTGLVLIITGWAVFSYRKYIAKRLENTTILIFLIGIAFTYSRATYLALVVSIMGYIFFNWWKSRKFSRTAVLSILAMIVIVGTAIILAPKPGGEGVDLLRTTSITARYTTSAEFLTTLQPWQWITGAGFYTRPVEIHDLTSHAKVPDNLLVFVLYSTGIVGVILTSWSGIKLSKYIATKNEVLLPVTAALLTHAQFNNSLLEPFVFLIGGILITGLVADKETSRYT